MNESRNTCNQGENLFYLKLPNDFYGGGHWCSTQISLNPFCQHWVSTPQLLKSFLQKAHTCPFPQSMTLDLDQRPGSAWEFATTQDGPRQWLMQEYESSALLPSGVTDFAEYFTLQNSPGIVISLALVKSCPQLAFWSSLSCPLSPLLASPGSTSLTNHWPSNPHLRTWFWGSWSKTTSGMGVIQVLELSDI